MSLFWPRSGACCCEETPTVPTPDCPCSESAAIIYMTACHPEFPEADNPAGGAGTFNSATLRYQPTPAWALDNFLVFTENCYLSDEEFPESPDDPTGLQFRYILQCFGSGAYILQKIYEDDGLGNPLLGNDLYLWTGGAPGNSCSPFRLMNGFLPTGSAYDRRAVMQLSAVEGDSECDFTYIEMRATTELPCSVEGVAFTMEDGIPSSGTAATGEFFYTRVPNPPAGPHDWTAALAPFAGTSGTTTTVYSVSEMTRDVRIDTVLDLPDDHFKYFGITLEEVPATISATFNGDANFGSLGGTTVTLDRTATDPAVWSACFPYTGGTFGDGTATVTVTFDPAELCDARPTAVATFGHAATCGGTVTTTVVLNVITGTTVAPIAFVATSVGRSIAISE